MASSEHLKIFQQGTAAWNQWRRKHHTVQPDLSHADLRGANLRSANLNHANLSFADLEGANLGRAYLEAAELQGANQRGAHLFDADLGRADLREMDLREAQLWHACLAGADLRGADLTAADLRYADLTAADLRGCVLRRANLEHTLLVGTDLRGTDLAGADLTGARLVETPLTDADLAGARLGLTAFQNVDLSRAEGLAALHHHRASSLGTDTLDLTAEGLRHAPERRADVATFLRHAGVQEPYLALFQQACDAPPAVAVFIRHSFADRTFAGRLHAALQERGVRCWLNEHPMVAGDDFEDSFDLRLHPSDKLLLCCSEASLTSWWLASELEHAAAQERRLADEQGVAVHALLAVDLDGFLAASRTSAFAAKIRPRLVASFGGWDWDRDAFARGVEPLLTALSAG